MPALLDTLLHIPDAKRNRLWLHRILQSLLWSEAAVPLLEEMACGWCDGLCHSCAKGILQYLQQANLPHDVVIEKVVVADVFSQPQHVAIRITVPGHEWYLDADGVSTREELLRRWEQEELVVLPSTECIDNDEWLEEEIASLPHVSAWVTNLLEENLGPFSLLWLKSERLRALLV